MEIIGGFERRTDGEGKAPASRQRVYRSCNGKSDSFVRRENCYTRAPGSSEEEKREKKKKKKKNIILIYLPDDKIRERKRVTSGFYRETQRRDRGAMYNSVSDIINNIRHFFSQYIYSNCIQKI